MKISLDEVKAIARQHYIKTGKKTKVALVREIQVAEGGEACYRTGKAYLCKQPACRWQASCR